ncbi:MAG: DUF1365 domain-containing protein [Rhodobacter sp.]|nr:DUF1365 domain-containing protein [Rhodobacter sp.]
MNRWPEHIAGTTSHARRGALAHGFRHGVDYVLIDPDAQAGPMLFSRNRFNLASVHDRNHGGTPGAGRGAAWARDVLAERGVHDVALMLLTQPRFLGYVFNPVSFWLAMDGDGLRAVIAEVNNTYGDRHSYFCANPDLAPIRGSDRIVAAKILHVSPFQDVAGDYAFAFDIRPGKIAIRIDFRNGDAGLVATLAGPRAPLSNASILIANLRRPLGALRIVALIHWQALRLKLKGARFRARPSPPGTEVS